MPYFTKHRSHAQHTTHTTQEPPHHRTHEQNTRPNHLAAIGGCATTVRATSHARVGGCAEVSMGSRVEVRRALARARVRRAPEVAGHSKDTKTTHTGSLSRPPSDSKKTFPSLQVSVFFCRFFNFLSDFFGGNAVGAARRCGASAAAPAPRSDG